jgi:hypothetical protein
MLITDTKAEDNGTMVMSKFGKSEDLVLGAVPKHELGREHGFD